jgi:hypothetical protein
MSTPINPKPRVNLRFLFGILFGFFAAYTLFYFHVTPFECAPCTNQTDTVVTMQCEVPKYMDTSTRFGISVDDPKAQELADKFQFSPELQVVNRTLGGRIGRANLQRLLNEMSPDRKWIHFRYGLYDGMDASGTTGRRLVVLFRNDAFNSASATHSTGTGRTIMNLGFCPADCEND